MSVRMTNDEIELLSKVIRNTSGKPAAYAVRKGYKSDSWVKLCIPKKDGGFKEIELQTTVPAIEGVTDAAAQMLMFMDLMEIPRRDATFFDYVSMAYEFGKQNK